MQAFSFVFCLLIRNFASAILLIAKTSMIYYFSGTGNSKHVAERLKQATGDELAEMTSTATLSACPTLGLVFPVYAWGIPAIVTDFITRNSNRIESSYLYAVMTCGDDIGYADHILNKLLNGRLDAAFSVHMPNTYVCLPGFDVDKDQVANAKVEATHQRLPHIAESINNKEKKTDVCRGKLPWLKTYILRPLFNRFLVTDKYFWTAKHCSRCKRCVRSCPLGNITLDQQGNIAWKHENCTGCLRCYHRCPNNAVQFGRFTKNKGQKIHDFD